MNTNASREIVLAAALIAMLTAPCLRGQETTSAAGSYQNQPPPAVICEKMSEKLLRGLTNVATSPLEVPKQLHATTRDRGFLLGSTVGLLKGIGMTAYRAIAGTLETALFIVPAPGYYDPMANPAFVWGD